MSLRPQIHKGAFCDMTNEQLQEEWLYWDAKVQNAPWWGASLKAASDFRDGCVAHLKSRGIPLLKHEAPE